jgi:uncharacterized membrane protein YfcA
VPGLDSLPLWALAWVILVIALAGLTHGVVGIGFPIVATPLLTLTLDIKTAMFFVMLPTIAVTAISTVQGGRWRESIGRYWYLPLLMGAGSHLGTRVFIAADPAPFILLLALLMLAYLNLQRLGLAEIAAVKRHPHAFALAFGLAAGLTEAMCNIAAPVLLIFFMLAGLPVTAMIQTLNLCFLAGKLAQAFTWGAVGDLGWTHFAATLPLAFVAALAFVGGSRIRKRSDAATYRGWLRKFLWSMVALLLAQFGQLLLARA